MKNIDNARELSPGTKIVNLNGDTVLYYDFLMIHPHNNEYVLLLDTITKNAIKFYIPRIENSKEWQIDYTESDLLEYRYEYHLEKARKILQKINDTVGISKEQILALQNIIEKLKESIHNDCRTN